VNCRVQALGRVARVPHVAPVPVAGVSPIKGRRRVYFGAVSGWLETDIYRREQLPVGHVLQGPAIVDEMSATLVLLPGQTLRVDSIGNLIASIP